MLQSDLFDCRDAYIVFKENITVSGNNNRDRKNRSLTFKNNVPFISWISQINSALIDNAEDLGVVKRL